MSEYDIVPLLGALATVVVVAAINFAVAFVLALIVVSSVGVAEVLKRR